MEERGFQYNSIKHRICFKVIMSLFKGYLQYPFSEFIVFIILKKLLVWLWKIQGPILFVPLWINYVRNVQFHVNKNAFLNTFFSD